MAKNTMSARTLTLRKQQLAQITTAVESLASAALAQKQQSATLALLQSVSQGLYEELDKLAKKAPADAVTDIVIEQVNDIIRETKALVLDDAYVQRYKEFVAAGDNPQHRDVVLVLRQLRQGLDRFGVALEPRRAITSARLADAKGVSIAIQLYLQGQEDVSQSDIRHNSEDVSAYWIFGTRFNTARLDQVSIPDHFRIPE